MGNVKVRKTRHLRQGADANPFPTTEQILTGVATGVVTNLAQRVIDKATQRIARIAKNTRAGNTSLAHVGESVVEVPPQPQVFTPAEAKREVAARKRRRKKKVATAAPRSVRK